MTGRVECGEPLRASPSQGAWAACPQNPTGAACCPQVWLVAWHLPHILDRPVRTRADSGTHPSALGASLDLLQPPCFATPLSWCPPVSRWADSGSRQLDAHNPVITGTPEKNEGQAEQVEKGAMTSQSRKLGGVGEPRAWRPVPCRALDTQKVRQGLSRSQGVSWLTWPLRGQRLCPEPLGG